MIRKSPDPAGFRTAGPAATSRPGRDSESPLRTITDVHPLMPAGQSTHEEVFQWRA